MAEPRILIYDIENTPGLGWVWEKYKTNVIEFDQDWQMLCFAYKWLGDKKIHTVALPDFAGYKPGMDRMNDYGVAAELWHLYDKADIVVAHNGNHFDQAKARARMLVHGFPPPSPFREVDTLQVARKLFKFSANSLDELCRQLKIGRKEATAGFHTWKGCINGDPGEWARMLRYNKNDVRMLEELYLRMLPWMPSHPNLAVVSGRPELCPKCGSDKGMIIRNTYKTYGVTRSRNYQCKNCGGYSTARVNERTLPRYK